MPEKKTKVKLDMAKFEMLPSYFDYIFVHLRQKVRLMPELSTKFLSSLGPNATPKARPDLRLYYRLNSLQNAKITKGKITVCVE